MKIKGLFWILTGLLLTILGVITYYVFYNLSSALFFLVEGLILITILYLFLFYRRIIKPLDIIGNGMELLKEQDFSSRLSRVGQKEADRIVDIFNKMMEQLKNERLHLREQNHFLDLLINASPMGVIMLNLDGEIISLNLSARMMFGQPSSVDFAGKSFAEIDSPLAVELARIPLYESQTVRLNDANIYKCTHSSFVDRGFHHSFYLVEILTQEVFKAEKKAYEKVIRMIAHEVNNTTAGITSTLDTLESTFSEMENTEDICDVLRVSIERCYSMSHFITNFADVVRIPEPQLRNHELNTVVTSCKRFMETICQNRNIRIIMELDEISPVVKLDSSLFEQVLVNIIKNAAESIGHDGQIYIRTSRNPVCLEITDTGKGIDKETEKKLFSPFFSTKPNGQGIGLIFIREVLQKQNCSFSLRTYTDGLTRFRILFE
ncbi:PAS domain-containing protein [Parabacteroides faecis]|uniref:sensor histidine kinase n=1 Tax=Parabacteroides TaxID=375288 RepID=UPI000EFF5BFB|nr:MULTISPECIES: ATP-binding protein [Parabacteroides]MBC8619496.1 PAS domain-containing protein [Parabacteroides faecis]RHR97655.1 PAS domain-containing protein [Parabacteroides sp. AF14-59]